MNRFRTFPIVLSMVVLVLLASAVALLLPASGTSQERGQLRIATSGFLVSRASGVKENDALQTLRGFIKDETGMENEIIRLKNWRELADKLAKKEVDLGVFQGFEFAWAQEIHPGLKPLALAVKFHLYPVAYLVARRDDKVRSFADLEGKSLSIPTSGQGFLELFIEGLTKRLNKKPNEFFSKTMNPDEIEDAIDDVVDGVVHAAVVDQASLQAYKRRKPGRFKRLQEIAHSDPFPPALVAFYEGHLDASTRKRFQDGLLNASKKERGKQMLTLFRLTSFESPPGDFVNILAETRKRYPGPETSGQ